MGLTMIAIALASLIAIATGCGKNDATEEDSSKQNVQKERDTSFADYLEKARNDAKRARCLKKLKELARAEEIWAADHEGKFSDSLSDLYPKYVASLDLFTCPSSSEEEITKSEDIDSKTSYVLRKGLTEASRDTEVLIIEAHANHEQRHNVAFVNTHVETLHSSRLKEILRADQGI